MLSPWNVHFNPLRVRRKFPLPDLTVKNCRAIVEHPGYGWMVGTYHLLPNLLRSLADRPRLSELALVTQWRKQRIAKQPKRANERFSNAKLYYSQQSSHTKHSSSACTIQSVDTPTMLNPDRLLTRHGFACCFGTNPSQRILTCLYRFRATLIFLRHLFSQHLSLVHETGGKVWVLWAKGVLCDSDGFRMHRRCFAVSSLRDDGPVRAVDKPTYEVYVKPWGFLSTVPTTILSKQH